MLQQLLALERHVSPVESDLNPEALQLRRQGAVADRKKELHLKVLVITVANMAGVAG